jgi:hypothetical protein
MAMIASGYGQCALMGRTHYCPQVWLGKSVCKDAAEMLENMALNKGFLCLKTS